MCKVKSPKDVFWRVRMTVSPPIGYRLWHCDDAHLIGAVWLVQEQRLLTTFTTDLDKIQVHMGSMAVLLTTISLFFVLNVSFILLYLFLYNIYNMFFSAASSIRRMVQTVANDLLLVAQTSARKPAPRSRRSHRWWDSSRPRPGSFMGWSLKHQETIWWSPRYPRWTWSTWFIIKKCCQLIDMIYNCGRCRRRLAKLRRFWGRSSGHISVYKQWSELDDSRLQTCIQR